MADGIVLIVLVGFIGFWAIGIIMGRWSVYEQIRDEHNLRVLEAYFEKRKDDVLSLKEVRDIIDGGNKDV